MKCITRFKNKIEESRNEVTPYTYGYYKTEDSKLFMDMLFKYMTKPVYWNPRISKLVNEYKNETTASYSVKVETNEIGEEVKYRNPHGGRPQWKVDLGFNVGSIEVEDEYENKFTVNENNGVKYNPVTNEMIRKEKSKLSAIGFSTMHLNSKDPDPSKGKKDESFTRLISFNKIFTNRTSPDLETLESNSFLGSFVMNEFSAKDYRDKPCDLFIKTAKYPYRTHTYSNSFTLEKVEEKGVYLKDYYIVLDFDNGAHLDKALECFKKLRFIPQLIIVEKGMGSTNKGNASMLMFLDAPIKENERKKITKAISAYMCLKGNVFGIDPKCSGTGYFKNPAKRWEGELQRELLAISFDENQVDLIDKEELICWADSYLVRSESKKSILYILDVLESNSAQFKGKALSFSEIENKIHKENITKGNSGYKSTLDNDIVSQGDRNDTSMKELAILLSQYYAIVGIDNAFSKPNLIRDFSERYKKVYGEGRYDNVDNTITLNYFESKVKYIVDKNIEAWRSNDEYAHKQFKENVVKQLVQITKYNNCQVTKMYPELDINDIQCEDEICGMIYSNSCKKYTTKSGKTSTWSDDQRYHATIVNRLTGALYSFLEYQGNDTNKIISTINEARKTGSSELVDNMKLNRVINTDKPEGEDRRSRYINYIKTQNMFTNYITTKRTARLVVRELQENDRSLSNASDALCMANVRHMVKNIRSLVTEMTRILLKFPQLCLEECENMEITGYDPKAMRSALRKVMTKLSKKSPRGGKITIGIVIPYIYELLNRACTGEIESVEYEVIRLLTSVSYNSIDRLISGTLVNKVNLKEEEVKRIMGNSYCEDYVNMDVSDMYKMLNFDLGKEFPIFFSFTSKILNHRIEAFEEQINNNHNLTAIEKRDDIAVIHNAFKHIDKDFNRYFVNTKEKLEETYWDKDKLGILDKISNFFESKMYENYKNTIITKYPSPVYYFKNSGNMNRNPLCFSC